MYNPAPFPIESRDEILQFIANYPLGLLISASRQGEIHATHAPMLLNRQGTSLRCHLARANDHWRQIEQAASVLVVFAGADHYVSPSWYPSKAEHGKVVPTWNYSAVHVRGNGRIFDGTELLDFVTQLTDSNEAAIQSGWKVSDAPVEYIQNLSRAIVGIEIRITSMEGKRKLSQNRPVWDQKGVIAGLDGLDTPAAADLARDMRAIER